MAENSDSNPTADRSNWSAELVEVYAKRAEEVQKNCYLITRSCYGFVALVLAGTSRISVKDSSCAERIFSATKEELVAIERECLGMEAPAMFTETFSEYTLCLSWDHSAVFAVHRDAPSWDGVFDVMDHGELDEVCCLGAQCIQATETIGNFVLNKNNCLDDVNATIGGIYERAHKDYVFAKVAGGCLGVKRSLLGAANPPIGVHEASCPVDATVLMLGGAPFIITNDATWGQILLGRIAATTGNCPGIFLIRFREAYTIEPAENAGGVVCSRRA